MKQSFETLKTSSLAHQLIKVGRLINERGLEDAKASFNLPELKQVHLNLFPFIDFEGTSISEIARRKQVSKQSVSKLVQEMVKMKILYLKSAPNDSRSKLVFFKTTGPYAIQNGFKCLMTIDDTLKQQLGENTYLKVLKEVSKIISSVAQE